MPSIPAHPSILIILMGSLGDVARGLCLVSALKSHFPGCRISWLIEPKWVELVRLHPQIDKIIVFRRSWRISAIWELFRNLQQNHFDITLDLQRILKSGIFSLFSGAKHRIGFHRRNAKEMSWIFNTEHIAAYSDSLPKILHYLKFAEHIGVPESNSHDFGFASLDTRTVAPPAVLQIQKPFVAIVLGSSWESKNWSFEGYRQLIQVILNKWELAAVLLGDTSQIAMSIRLEKTLESSDLLNIAGKTMLPELVAVLKCAAAGVGPDSGAGHLAAAVQTPFVTLFGPTAPDRTAPDGYRHLVVQSEIDCAPCYKKNCPGLGQKCMHSIRFKSVTAKLEEALSARC